MNPNSRKLFRKMTPLRRWRKSFAVPGFSGAHLSPRMSGWTRRAKKTTPQGWKAQLDHELRELTEANLRRGFTHGRGNAGGRPCVYGGRTLVNLSSNNYLGLASYPALIEASVEAARASGVSGAASPLISGHMAAHEDLASALAAFKRKAAALVFGSGVFWRM